MFFRKRKDQKQLEDELQKTVGKAVQQNHARITKSIVDATKVTDGLNEIIRKNGFTIKIQAAAARKNHRHAN